MKYYRDISMDGILNLILDDNTSVLIRDENELNKICNTDQSSGQLSINNKTFTKANIKHMDFLPNWNLINIPNHFGLFFNNLETINNFPNNIETIGINFLSNCKNFNSPLTFSSNLKSIGYGFISNSPKFNQPISLISTKVKDIPTHFLSNCTAFNSILYLPTSINSIGGYFLDNDINFNQTLSILLSSLSFKFSIYFMKNCDNYTSKITINKNFINAISDDSYNSNEMFSTKNSSARCYSTGIRFYCSDGSFSSLHNKLPDRTISPYRKIIQG